MAVSGLNNIAQVATAAWIDRNGGDAKAVKFVEMPFPAMVPALAAGTIQSSSAYEPWLSNAHHAESAPILAKYSKIPAETITHMRRGDFAERFDPALIQPVIDAAAKYGIIAVPFRASEIIFGAP
jgi:ABC-type nitrate/sulfonate/bicarbonate transport system substrate-binding protein